MLICCFIVLRPSAPVLPLWFATLRGCFFSNPPSEEVVPRGATRTPQGNSGRIVCLIFIASGGCFTAVKRRRIMSMHGLCKTSYSIKSAKADTSWCLLIYERPMLLEGEVDCPLQFPRRFCLEAHERLKIRAYQHHLICSREGKNQPSGWRRSYSRTRILMQYIRWELTLLSWRRTWIKKLLAILDIEQKLLLVVKWSSMSVKRKASGLVPKNWLPANGLELYFPSSSNLLKSWLLGIE